MEIPRITPQQVLARQGRGEQMVFVDARSAAAWSRAYDQVPGSIRVPPDQIDAHLAAVPHAGLIVAYCT